VGPRSQQTSYKKKANSKSSGKQGGGGFGGEKGSPTLGGGMEVRNCCLDCGPNMGATKQNACDLLKFFSQALETKKNSYHGGRNDESGLASRG